MATSISWTDSTGAASLTNGKITPGDRFASWTPRSIPFTGAEDWALGTADLCIFEFREDHSAAFEIVGIPYSSLDLMLRLQSHLEGGGNCQVTTGDRDSNVYPDCCLAENATVDIALTDKVMLEYTMTMQLLNVDGVQMLCRY